MKKPLLKILTSVLFIILALALFAGCSPAEDTGLGGKAGDGDAEAGAETFDFVQERKIIYEISFELTCADITAAKALIKSNMKAGEWFDQEHDYEGKSYIVARVKSDRVDEFVEAVSAGGERASYSKTATDVSVNYVDKQSKIDSLVSEKKAYNLLKDSGNCTIGEIITIEKRIAEIDLELSRLQGELNQYDSKIEYSTVSITLYGQGAAAQKLSFGKRLGNALKDGWNALLSFFEFLLVILAAALPFLVPAALIFTTVFLIMRWKRKKRIKETGGEPPNKNS